MKGERIFGKESQKKMDCGCIGCCYVLHYALWLWRFYKSSRDRYRLWNTGNEKNGQHGAFSEVEVLPELELSLAAEISGCQCYWWFFPLEESQQSSGIRKRETDKRRGQPHFGCPHVQTEDNILTNVWSLEDSLWESPPYPWHYFKVKCYQSLTPIHFIIRWFASTKKICLNSFHNNDIIFWVYMPFKNICFYFVMKSIRCTKRVTDFL